MMGMIVVVSARFALGEVGQEVVAETTALHGLVDGLAIHLLVNPDPGFRRQTLRKIEVSIDRLRP